MPPLDRKAQKERLEIEAQLKFIKNIFDRKLPVYLLGSYADDALLHQAPSRWHHDVDLVARRSDMELLKSEFESLGLKIKEEAFVPGDKPYKLLVKGQHLLVDVGFLDSDESGTPFIDTHHPVTGERLHVHFDDDIFNQQPIQLGDMMVATVSPLALIRSKDAHFQAGTRPSRAKDIQRKNVLIKKFYPNEDPGSDYFKLRISKAN